MALFTKLPSWASILITVIAAIIVVGLVSWGTYTLVKPGPEKLPEGEEAVEEGEELPEEEDETADWKTYRNETLGIEFKYPKDWEINDSSPMDVSFKKRINDDPVMNSIYFGLSIYDNKNNISLEDYYTMGLNLNVSKECISFSKTTTINNNKVVMIVDKCGLSAVTNFLVAKDQKVFILHSMFSAPLEEMMNTFKFID